MNKKGFTLVELLAVIVILATLALLVGTSVTKIVKDSKTDLSSIQMELIESAAKAWGAENIDRIPSANGCKIIKLSDLIEEGFLEETPTDPSKNTKFSNIDIKISTKLNIHGNLVTTYEVNPSNTVGCSLVYTPTN